MSLLEQIKQDQIAARKSADRTTDIGKMKISALTTLIGEASPAGNATASDEDVLKVIRKFVKNLDETIKTVDVEHKITSFEQAAETLKDCSKLMMLLIERQLYTGYLPKVFDSADIRDIIVNMSGANIGQVMGACKKAAQEQGKMFDGALVRKEMGV
ncbi:hypothetical protein phiAS5_ORF0042 [Aeromonas phage phiAS5]|uniref:Uncharacterized protein n=1 Tax=Aeromonas phage phiAS5 TaxID=879630 RepID=E1A2D9_9CAUD|nr:tRNA amidotransferase [Aeromonas phage phiAS5]ADM79885.1 hypothetical protein phiAS5_ORF0042 [Aeromonas phage phiAS5]